jgi:hypothetical protein
MLRNLAITLIIGTTLHRSLPPDAILPPALAMLWLSCFPTSPLSKHSQTLSPGILEADALTNCSNLSILSSAPKIKRLT